MTISYKKFRINQLFEIETGIRPLKAMDLNDYGETPVYSSSSENGGLYGYTSKEPMFIVDDENPFYLIFGDHTKTMFFVSNNFSVMDNLKVLKPKKHDYKSLLYIITIWRKNIPSLGYSRHWSVAKDVLLDLPCDGNHPDWKYMNEYITSVENKYQSLISLVNLMK